MDNDRIIIILLTLIVVILVVGLLFVNPFTSKQDCRLEILSMDSLNVGDQLTVFLCDSQGNPISNEDIVVSFTGSGSANKQVTTDANGNAQVGFEDLPVGEYNVTCTLVKNDKYKECSISKKITINSPQTTKTSESNGLSEDGYSYLPEYGPAVDAMGQTRQQAIANNWHYIPQRIDGQDAGIYVPYDSKAGCYHT